MIRRKPLSLTARRQGTAEPMAADDGNEYPSEARVSIPPEGTEQDVCVCAGAGLPLLAETCETTDDILAICVLRFVLAGYCHDKMQCFDAAIDAAASIHGEQLGLALMTRAVAVVRALRADRNGNFRYLPANCCRISED
jgi:acyl CoA:acetate/3-ketoacid CoA transferase alpha subunit